MEHFQLDIGYYEYLRHQAREKFDKIKSTWLELGKWALPHRIKWMLSQNEGERNNQHIVDPTHKLAHRSYVAGFLEGNTSASRPWYRVGSGSTEKNIIPENKLWLEIFTRRTLKTLDRSNFYDAAGQFYSDYGVFNTGSYYIDEMENGVLFWHVLIPGSYYVINDSFGNAIVLVREMSLTVKALVEKYGKVKGGKPDWSNFSARIRKMYEDGNYVQLIDIVQCVKQNDIFNPLEPHAGTNRKWVSITYELGGSSGPWYQDGQEFGPGSTPDNDENIALSVSMAKRKPFIIGKSQSNSNYEYGETGPTLDALGLIKSLNKKAIGKDQALEQMLRPALQGPANLRKSYITTAPNTYIPLDAQSISQKGLRTVFEVNPGIAEIVQDVAEMRKQVDKFYYADFLLFLSNNPKTRTATETEAIVKEQQLVIGPNLQSLNWTHNVPVVDYVMDFVLDKDPFLPPPPDDLAGEFLKPEFISVFAQAQKAADLPAVDRYAAMVERVASLKPEILAKFNVDKYANIYEDRLYLPAGLNNSDEKANEIREKQAAAAQKREQMEQMVQAAGAAKDVGIQANQQEASSG